MSPPKRTENPVVRLVVLYLVMLAFAIIGYLVIRAGGLTLPAGMPAVLHETAAKGLTTEPLAHVLFALAIITIAARGTGLLFQRFLNQPPVIGEILAGLALGPSLLGFFSPELQNFVLPAAAAPLIGIIAKFGVVLFMFLVGLELDLKILKQSSQATVVISHASIIAPFLLGAVLALGLYPLYATADVSFTVFSLFIGVSMSVTAFPVLARILTDRRVQRTRIGTLALACAAVDDATAWTLLAFVAGVASAKTAGIAWTIGLSIVFIIAMFWIARPLMRKLAEREEKNTAPMSQGVLAVVCIALLLAGSATEFIGIHALFGAFLLGAIMPHHGRLAEQVRLRMEDVVVVLLLPAFFAFTGMRTQVGLLHTTADWLAVLAIIAVATAGKFGGSFIAARLVGMGWREAGAIGILMNTRGLMELIALNLGLEMGVISPKLFAMLVIMALVTTFATTPILNLIMGKRGFGDEPAAPLQDVQRAQHS
ncbi:cation:proton antiporter [Uliginosibacterium sp. H3]|uniref:Cation:proton antiporter n=1 Tax=Uliginosibacterium silvisoli TaxID=3114758 RepID=A0ABU6JYP5_9RHOO|nr:cation:proton antiporter [Uliginosibacterium sp. H3]